MSDTIKPRQDNPNAAWTPKVSDRLQVEVDALRSDNTRIQNEVVGPLRERVKLLEDALQEYANPLNWNEDSQGIRRVWLEPGSTTPAAYNGFEAARAALAARKGTT